MSDRAGRTAHRRLLGALLLGCYTSLVPLVLWLVSLEQTWAALAAMAGGLLTLPLWPVLAVVLIPAGQWAPLGGLLAAAWVGALAQVWIGWILLRHRAGRRDTTPAAELGRLVGPSTAVLVLVLAGGLLVLAWLKAGL